jgi:hypothetical protein
MAMDGRPEAAQRHPGEGHAGDQIGVHFWVRVGGRQPGFEGPVAGAVGDRAEAAAIIVGIGEGRKHQGAGAAKPRSVARLGRRQFGDASILDTDADTQPHRLPPGMGEQAPGIYAVYIFGHPTYTKDH